MPEIFRFAGFVFYFYSREHESIHVHVEGNGGNVIFDIIDSDLVIREIHNLKDNDLKRIKRFAKHNIDIIIDEWNNHFGKKEE